jgi:hypothetical protein
MADSAILNAGPSIWLMSANVPYVRHQVLAGTTLALDNLHTWSEAKLGKLCTQLWILNYLQFRNCLFHAELGPTEIGCRFVFHCQPQT